MLVSIVVNNYNYARYLSSAIDSALAQTYPDVDVVVVDDGSTDGSREVIGAYGGDVRPVLKQNGGQTSAMNTGFEHARGDVIVFLDADDLLEPGAVERVVALWGDDVAKLVERDGEDFGPPDDGAAALAELENVRVHDLTGAAA